MIDWQPLVDVAAKWLSWGPWKWLVFGLIVWHGMIGRANAVRWVEALGWDGVRELLAGFGNSPSSLMQARVDAINAETPKPTNLADIRRP